MVTFIKDCCGCATPGYPCLGNACGFGSYKKNCDECGREVETLYKVDNEELCDKCALSRLEEV